MVFPNQGVCLRAYLLILFPYLLVLGAKVINVFEICITFIKIILITYLVALCPEINIKNIKMKVCKFGKVLKNEKYWDE